MAVRCAREGWGWAGDGRRRLMKRRGWRRGLPVFFNPHVHVRRPRTTIFARCTHKCTYNTYIDTRYFIQHPFGIRAHTHTHTQKTRNKDISRGVILGAFRVLLSLYRVFRGLTPFIK